MSSDPQVPADIPLFLSTIIRSAVDGCASDIHVEPVANGYEIRFRRDGLLELHQKIDADTGRSVIMRLMVLAQLLTYRQDIPQEGRIRYECPLCQGSAIDLRLAIIPTTFGLRAAVRLPAELIQPRTLEMLGLPVAITDGLASFAKADSGMLIVTGPAGSGKTTTIYALLEYITRTSPGLSVMTIEDPVERQISGVTQIEIQPFGELTYERVLKSILRQDPQVLMLGEIRDAATASLAIQAALSGHRLICTYHAASPQGAIARLFEMGLEPYQITSSLFGILNQRLLRRCKKEGGYAGRIPVAELALMSEELRRAIISRADSATLGEIIRKSPKFMSHQEAARLLMVEGMTDQAEITRVLGS